MNTAYSQKFSTSSGNQRKFIFDLDALKNGHKNEIKRVGENFDKINQRQRDLIRHNVSPDVFKEIRMIFDKLSETINSTHKRTFDSFDRADERQAKFHKSVNESKMSREEKRDSREASDRQHERSQETLKHNHAKTMDTLKSVAGYTLLATAVTAASLAIASSIKKNN
jgi:hypothetical protein